MIRPQQKRAKQHQALLASIKKGDKVVTNSGILATVVKVVNDNEIILEIANGVHVKFVKSTISNVIDPKNTTPTNLNESTKSVKKIEKINDKHETVEKTEENNNENKESSVIIDDKK